MQEHQPIRKKGNGRAVHVSDFITEPNGRLVLSEAEMEAQAILPASKQLSVTDARKIIYPGKNYDAWWDGKQLDEQVRINLKYTVPSTEISLTC